MLAELIIYCKKIFKQILKMKILKETLEYAYGLTKIWDKDTPAQLIFFVTNRCNARCRHCFYWKELNRKREDELSLEEIKKISKSMGRLIWFFLSGGEPFVRKDLVQICQTFYQNNQPKSIIIPTNGTLVNKIIKDVAAIAGFCPRAKLVIQISIDEIGGKHDKIRGVPGNFAKIEELIPKLKRLQKRHPNLAIQANIVFCAYNQDRVIEIYDYIYEKFGIDNICLSLVRGNPREIGAGDVDLGKYWQAHQYLRKTQRFAQYTPILSHLITKKEDMQIEVFLKSFKEKKAIIPCLVAKQTVILQPNGDLSLCEMRPEKFGNLREVDYDFAKLWQGQRKDKLRERVKGCYCTQECVYTTNVFLNPKVWPMFLKYILFKKI